MIDIRNLEHRYPDGTFALKGINLAIPDGEFLLICGPNGSGKTTLIRHINGLLRPSRGSVLVDGLDTTRHEHEVMQRVGMVFQDADSHIVGETVWEDVAFGPENQGLAPGEVESRVLSALRTVGIEEMADRPCHLLSGGEKRRVAVAGVLAMLPHTLIFDEPFANLDFLGVQQILQQIVELHQAGHTIVVTTHDVEKVVAHVSRIAILFQGEIKALGPPEEVIPQLPLFHIRPPCFSLLGERMLSWLAD